MTRTAPCEPGQQPGDAEIYAALTAKAVDEAIASRSSDAKFFAGFVF